MAMISRAEPAYRTFKTSWTQQDLASLCRKLYMSHSDTDMEKMEQQRQKALVGSMIERSSYDTETKSNAYIPDHEAYEHVNLAVSSKVQLDLEAFFDCSICFVQPSHTECDNVMYYREMWLDPCRGQFTTSSRLDSASMDSTVKSSQDIRMICSSELVCCREANGPGK